MSRPLSVLLRPLRLAVALFPVTTVGPAGVAAPAPGGAPADSAAAACTNQPAAVDSVRAVLGKWLETQQAIARERREWQQGQEIMEARLEVLKKELEDVSGQLAKAKSALAETTKQQDEARAQADQLKATADRLAEAAGGFEARIRQLHAQMPEPFPPRVAQLFQRLPPDAASTRVSVAERYQNILGILNEMNKFNTELPLSYEVRTLSDGKPSEVKAFYVGLAQGYYVSAQGEAGIGRPGEKGWTWEPANDRAEAIRRALDVLQNKGSPAFIPLPMSLK